MTKYIQLNVMDKVLLNAYDEHIIAMCRKRKRAGKSAIISYAGKELTLKEWSRILDIKYDALRSRYRKHKKQVDVWPLDRVLSPELQRNGRKA